MSVEVRSFKQHDREQPTELVNAHVAAVVPGVSVSVNAVMSQLERESSEFIVDPWVIERRTLVAVERDAIVAGAHLLRYGPEDRVGDSYRNAGEVRWLVCNRNERLAGDAPLAACFEVMDDWKVGRQYADGSLPSVGTYGVPACWPHIRDIYTGGGLVFDGHLEIILIAGVDQLPEPTTPPITGLTVLRSVGDCGTRFSALLDVETVGNIEVETDMTDGGTRSRFAGWGDIGNLHTAEGFAGRAWAPGSWPTQPTGSGWDAWKGSSPTFRRRTTTKWASSTVSGSKSSPEPSGVGAERASDHSLEETPSSERAHRSCGRPRDLALGVRLPPADEDLRSLRLAVVGLRDTRDKTGLIHQAQPGGPRKQTAIVPVVDHFHLAVLSTQHVGEIHKVRGVVRIRIP